jgi:hypothetical protein
MINAQVKLISPPVPLSIKQITFIELLIFWIIWLKFKASSEPGQDPKPPSLDPYSVPLAFKLIINVNLAMLLKLGWFCYAPLYYAIIF